MTLAALHLLAHVKPARTAAFRGLYALAVDDAGRRSGFASLPAACAFDQRGIDSRPQARSAPAIEIILYRRARRQILRQRTPLAPCGIDVEDRIHDHPQVDLARTTAPTSPGHE